MSCSGPAGAFLPLRHDDPASSTGVGGTACGARRYDQQLFPTSLLLSASAKRRFHGNLSKKPDVPHFSSGFSQFLAKTALRVDFHFPWKSFQAGTLGSSRAESFYIFHHSSSEQREPAASARCHGATHAITFIFRFLRKGVFPGQCVR